MFIIGVLIVLGVLVVVHEFGHYIAARSFGVEVEKFSIGFGPKLLGYNYKGTNFLISLIPLGGYVKMSGDEPKEGVEFSEKDFYGKKWWQRVIIVFAGPMANLLLGFVLFSFSFWIGRTIEDHKPIVGRVSSQYESLLLPQDRIVALNNSDIEYWSQLPEKTQKDDINEVVILRDELLIKMVTRDIQPTTWYTDIQPIVLPMVGSVTPGMPAYRAGLQVDDLILAVDGQEVDSWYDMRELIANHQEDIVELTIRRGEDTLTISIDLEKNIFFDAEQKMIGITQKQPVSYFQRFGVIESINYGAISSVAFIAVNYYALFKLISRPVMAKDQLGGPVMIVAMSKQTTELGWGAIIYFVASISLILMIMNLLPIPILDGGHIFFYFIEGVFKKPIPLKTQALIQQIGFMILIALMIFVFYNDITRLFRRDQAIRSQQQAIENVEIPDSTY